VLDVDPTAFSVTTVDSAAGGAGAEDARVKISRRRASAAGITVRVAIAATHNFRLVLGPFRSEQPDTPGGLLTANVVVSIPQLQGAAVAATLQPTSLKPHVIQEAADKGGASRLIPTAPARAASPAAAPPAAPAGTLLGGVLTWATHMATSAVGMVGTAVDLAGAKRNVAVGACADAIVHLSSRAKQQALLTGREVITFQGFQLVARPAFFPPPAAYDRGWYQRIETMPSVAWRDLVLESTLAHYHWSPVRWTEAERRAKGLSDTALQRKVAQTAYLATFFAMRTCVFYTADGVERELEHRCAAEAFTKPVPWPAAVQDRLDTALQPTAITVAEADALERVQALRAAGRNPAVVVFTDATCIGGKYAEGETGADADLAVRTNWSWCVNKALHDGPLVKQTVPVVEAIPAYGAVYCDNVLVLRDNAASGA
jgi:hypothetical protein